MLIYKNMAPKKTGNKKKAYKTTVTSYNRQYKNKYGTKGTITTLSDASDKKSFSGNLFHFSETDARQCVQNIQCSPAMNKKKINAAGDGYDTVACFPEWLKCKQDYTHGRVIYFSAAVNFNSTESSVHSCVERDGEPLSDTDRMLQSGNMKTHMLDADNKKVFRAWKASTPQEMAWLPIVNIQQMGSNVPAHIKMLQDMLPLAPAGLDPTAAANVKRHKCEVQLKCVVEFKGKSTVLGQTSVAANAVGHAVAAPPLNT